MISVTIRLNKQEGSLLADLLELALLISNEKGKENLYDRIAFSTVCEIYQSFIGKLRTISPNKTASLTLKEPRALSLLAVLLVLEEHAFNMDNDHRAFAMELKTIIHQKTT